VDAIEHVQEIEAVADMTEALPHTNRLQEDLTVPRQQIQR
jgi:hypothetical protein